MDPALLTKLSHNGVDKGMTSARLFPGLEILVIFVPIYLNADWISFHFVEIGSECADAIIEFPPKQLTDETDRGLRLLTVESAESLVKAVPKQTWRQTAKLEIRTQNRGGRFQSVGRGLRFFEFSNSRSPLTMSLEPRESRSFTAGKDYG